MTKKTPKQPKQKTPPKERNLSKDEFYKALDKVILTVKKPESPAKGKKGTSE